MLYVIYNIHSYTDVTVSKHSAPAVCVYKTQNIKINYKLSPDKI